MAFSAETVCVCLNEEELPSRSQILSKKNEPLCLFCCVNTSHCVTFVFLMPLCVMFVESLDLVCKLVPTANAAAP